MINDLRTHGLDFLQKHSLAYLLVTGRLCCQFSRILFWYFTLYETSYLNLSLFLSLSTTATVLLSVIPQS